MSLYNNLKRSASMNRNFPYYARIAAAASASIGTLALALLQPVPARAADAAASNASVERGRYIVRTSGCNDCHTPGYGDTGGRLPESQWLTGSSVGFRGPWGTSYPANLRLTVRGMTEDQWLVFARAERLPPMPWFSLAAMTEADLRAMYRYIRSLGASGERAPAPLPPGKEGKLPFIPFMPQAPQLARSR
jgi:mono/diheme cytochrome c family protein